jgi:hypothetical protein
VVPTLWLGLMGASELWGPRRVTPSGDVRRRHARCLRAQGCSSEWPEIWPGDNIAASVAHGAQSNNKQSSEILHLPLTKSGIGVIGAHRGHWRRTSRALDVRGALHPNGW